MLNPLKRLCRGESLKIAVKSSVGEKQTQRLGKAQNLEILHFDFICNQPLFVLMTLKLTIAFGVHLRGGLFAWHTPGPGFNL